MSLENFSPTTLDGIKRLATRIKKTNDTKHFAALDIAATQAGFRDFREAQKILSLQLFVTIRLSGYFIEDGKKKTLIAEVRLNRGLQSFLRPQDLKKCDRFHRMQIVADDRIDAHFYNVRNIAYVRQSIAKTARILQFMEATGLKPSSAEIFGRHSFNSNRRLPYQDHAITWRDPQTKALMMTDEPYGHVDQKSQERERWAKEQGYAIRRLGWGGTYFPEGGSVCDLVSHTEKGVPIDLIADCMGNAAPCFREDTARWILIDGFYDEPTPGEVAEKERKTTGFQKASTPKAPPRHGTSLTYANGQKRPAAALPLNRHAEIGLILREAQVITLERKGAQNALTKLCFLLEEWVDAETGGKLPNEQLFALYADDLPHGTEITKRLIFGRPDAELKKATLDSLSQARKWLVDGYPDGLGRDRALKLLDKATTSLEAFKAHS